MSIKMQVRRCGTLLALVVLASALTSLEARADGAPDLLEEARQRQRIADERATARALALGLRAVLVLPVAPQVTAVLWKQAVDSVREDPDLSLPCRERLLTWLSLPLPS